MRLIFSGFVLLALSCTSPDPFNFRTLACSQYLDLAGTAVRGLAGDDRYLYVGHDGGVRAYALFSTMQPDPGTQLPYRLAGEVAGDPAQALAIDGTHLYVAEGSKVRAYDLAEMPPKSLGSVSIGESGGVGVASGGWYFVASGAGTVRQVDLRDPSSPKLANELNPPGEGAVTHLVWKGERLFVLNGEAVVHVYRFDGEGEAFPEASLAVSFVPTGLVLAGERLVAGELGRIAIFNVGGVPVPEGERAVDVQAIGEAGRFEMKGEAIAGWGGRAIGRAGGALVAAKLDGAAAEPTKLPCTGPTLNPGRLVVQGDRLVIYDNVTSKLTGIFPER